MNAVRYKYYLLVILMTVWACNAMDNVALGLVMQNIKTDLHLSDTQLGVLTGIAFALFYSVMGIPIARWADRGNRITILSLTAAVWSALVALCGTAGSFWQLMLFRIGVGIGEAGCAPASQSLLADYFSRAERPRATSIFLLGDALSMFMGLFVAGWVAQLYGWRVMFMMLGLPGLVIAAVVLFTLEEPRLSNSQVVASAGQPRARERRCGTHNGSGGGSPTLRDTARALLGNTTYRCLLLYTSVSSFFATGIMQWQPAFLIRSHGMKTGELGTWLAVLHGLAIVVGRYWGGELASRFAANNERLQLKGMAIAYSVSGILSTFIYLTPNRYVAFGCMGLSFIAMNAIMPSMYSTIQTLVPGRMRAVSVAVMFFCGALIGNGLGPLAAGALSDSLRLFAGADSLRFALLALCPGYVWGAWFLWRASQTVTRDLQRVQEEYLGSDDGQDVLLRTS